jgi:hypothetical protein
MSFRLATASLLSVATLIVCGLTLPLAAPVQPQVTTTPVITAAPPVTPPKKAPPLEALTSFATLAAAIAISYAGLANFRHRLRVQEYVRSAVEDANLIILLGTRENPDPLCCHDRYAILYRLGKLRDVRNAHQPGAHPVGTPPSSIVLDEDFRQTVSYKAYSWVYASNLDKVIAVCLGALSGAAIWFAALDNIYFYDSLIDAPARIAFFQDAECFYWLAILLGIIAVITHKFLWKWELELTPKTDRLLHIFGGLIALAFFGLLFLSSNSRPFYHVAAIWWATADDHYLFVMTETILFTVTLVPLFLVWGGEKLTKTMTTKADGCIKFLVEEIGARPNAARIREPDLRG